MTSCYYADHWDQISVNVESKQKWFAYKKMKLKMSSAICYRLNILCADPAYTQADSIREPP